MPTRNFQAGEILAIKMHEYKRCPHDIEEYISWCDSASLKRGDLEGLTSLQHWPQIVSDYSIPILWATVFYFSKASKSSKILFDLIKHIQENWNFYRLQYQIVGKNYRNDFAFSIALHIMSNPQVDLPGTHYYTTDRDKLYKGNENSFQFFLENQTACGINNQNIHMMNKFDLNEHIDKVMQ